MREIVVHKASLPVPVGHDPAPSRLRYRLHRLWLRPWIRAVAKFGPPLAALALSVWTIAGNQEIRDAISAKAADLRKSFAGIPELAVRDIDVPDVSEDLRKQILEVASVDVPLSSLDIDVESLRERVAAIDAVQSANVRIRTDGVLEIDITERTPVAVWRQDGALYLVDAEGYKVARLAARGLRSDLLLIAGEGAPQAVQEAEDLVAASGPLAGRIRGLVRQGERRWDIVLDRNLVIALPETDPQAALERVIALDQAHDLLERDILVIDMRDERRPVLRLSGQAVEELRRIRSDVPGEET
jgi:cell division protein FtsQ